MVERVCPCAVTEERAGSVDDTTDAIRAVPCIRFIRLILAC